MERILQYFDELDDLVYFVALAWERIRRLLSFVVQVTTLIAVGASGMYAALTAPPLAVAIATLLLVTLLYRSVVYHSPTRHTAA